MSCKIAKLDTCHLVQESFKSPTLEFPVDVSEDAFVYKINRYLAKHRVKEHATNLLDNNTLYFEPLNLPIGDYEHELLWTRNNVTEVVFQGRIKITDKATNCGCNVNTTLKVEVVNEVVNVKVDFSERVIERVIEKGPQGEQGIQGVQGEKGDKGDVGEQGIQGIQGEQGIQGIQGIQGEQGIQGFNGWTPIHEFESDGLQRQVKKLTDYIGGTGDKPTQNIGQYVIDGGYTTDKSLATNFKGATGDNLIFEYVHSGNKEVRDLQVNYSTYTFNKNAHGFVNGNAIFFCVASVSYSGSNNSELDRYLPTGVSFNQRYYVVNATANSFQIATSNGGTPITFTEKETVNFWFEQQTSMFIYVSNLPNINNVRTVFSGRIFAGTYLGPSIGNNPQNPHNTPDWTWKGTVNSSTGSLSSVSGIGTIESIVFKQSNMITIKYNAIIVNQTSITNYSTNTIAIGYNPNYNGVVMGIVSYNSAFVQNGDTLKVFKL